MPKPIDRSEVQRLVQAGAQLVEVLPPEEYKEEHLPGAVSVPLRRIESQARELLDPNRPVIVYCFDAG
jgi:rhodanese-related sulfurtransferase